MNQDYDAVIIGGGHNGLVAANYLAKAGLSVGLFERRGSVGGIAATKELIPNFFFNTGLSDLGLLGSGMIQDLKLESHGLEFIESLTLAFAPQPDGSAITLWADRNRTIRELESISVVDAEAYANYLDQLDSFSSLLIEMAQLAPPSLRYKTMPLMLSWAKVAIKARRLGAKDMMEFLRSLPMDMKRFLDERFESEALKGMLGAGGLAWLQQGPRAAGTTFMLLYQQIAGRNNAHANQIIRGGVGQLSKALASSATERGIDIQVNKQIKRILVKDESAVGVELANGEKVSAKVVLSGADPKHTFMDLVGSPQLEPRVVRRLQALKLSGSTVTVHLALNGLPQFTATAGNAAQLSGAIVICPNLDYAERAHDDAKFGRISRQPILEARIPSVLDPSFSPDGQHAMSIIFRFAPYHLRESDWDSQRDAIADLAVKTMAGYAPGMEKLVAERAVITPLDYERDYGLTQGSFTQGQMSLDQLLLMRPISGFAGYRGPIDKLYLCGSGAHPGGGLTGAPGRNAARQVLQEI